MLLKRRRTSLNKLSPRKGRKVPGHQNRRGCCCRVKRHKEREKEHGKKNRKKRMAMTGSTKKTTCGYSLFLCTSVAKCTLRAYRRGDPPSPGREGVGMGHFPAQDIKARVCGGTRKAGTTRKEEKKAVCRYKGFNSTKKGKIKLTKSLVPDNIISSRKKSNQPRSFA